MIGKCAYAIRRASMVLYGHVTDRCPCSSPSYFVNKMMMKHPFWQSMLMRVFLYVWLGACDGNGVSLFYLYLDGSVLLLLVTLSMLMDRAGCYNVREKKLVVRQLTSTVNSYGIATFSVRGEGQRF